MDLQNWHLIAPQLLPMLEKESQKKHPPAQIDFDTLFKTEKVAQIACWREGGGVGGLIWAMAKGKSVFCWDSVPYSSTKTKIPHQSPPPPQTASPRHYFF